MMRGKCMPKVSVIVPVYNVEKYLKRCLESILNQTEKDIEVIIVNDGSTDKSQDIIDVYVNEYPDKIIPLIKENGGLSDARNYGIPYATGEYIAFLDSDDYVDCGLYEKMLQSTDGGKKLIVSCGYVMEWNDHSKIKRDDCPDSIEDYLCKGLVVAWNKLYKREWLIETKVKFPKGLLYEDTEFFCKIVTYLDSIDQIGFVDEQYVHYVQRYNSISYSSSSRIDDIHKTCDDVLADYERRNLPEKYKSAVEYKYVKALLGSFLLKYLRINKFKEKYNALKNNWNFINQTFPNWKKNTYLKLESSIIARCYLKNVCKPIYLGFSLIPQCAIRRLMK